MSYQRGEVVTVPFPYTNLAQTKLRPVLIVSSDAYNVASPHVVAAQITTKVTRAGSFDHVLIDWKAAGLKYPSAVRTNLSTIENAIIQRLIGRLTLNDLAQFDIKICMALTTDVAAASYLRTNVTLEQLPGALVQGLSEKVVGAAVTIAGSEPAIDLDHLRSLIS
jgi:mRNA interferase MazF